MFNSLGSGRFRDGTHSGWYDPLCLQEHTSLSWLQPGEYYYNLRFEHFAS